MARTNIRIWKELEMSTKVKSLLFILLAVALSLAVLSCRGGGSLKATDEEGPARVETGEGAAGEEGAVKGKVLLAIAQRGFQDIEYDAVRKALTAAGYEVVTASLQRGKATGTSGAFVDVDLSLAEAVAADYAAVVFIGGEGTPSLYGNADAHRLAREAAERGKVLAAICLAPVILARAGLLDGKRATVYPSASRELTEGGATYTGVGVEIDGRLVTGDGPESAGQFAQTIIELLP